MATGSKGVARYGSGAVCAKIGFYRRWYGIARLGGTKGHISIDLGLVDGYIAPFGPQSLVYSADFAGDVHVCAVGSPHPIQAEVEISAGGLALRVEISNEVFDGAFVHAESAVVGYHSIRIPSNTLSFWKSKLFPTSLR